MYAPFHSRPTQRRGNVIVLTAVLLSALLAMVAFSVDLGYVFVARAELQRTADSAAIAAAWELVDATAKSAPSSLENIPKARIIAANYAGYNPVCAKSPLVDANAGNAATGDLVFGYLAQPTLPGQPLDLQQLDKANAVQVSVRRTSAMNGEVPLFFGRVMGRAGIANQAQATAAVASEFVGFRTPAGGGNLDLLPFALDVDTWNGMLAGGGADKWTRSWDDATKKWTVKSGGDGVREVNLFPQGTGSPGNRGTIDIGGSNNSTKDIARQITDGVSSEDLAHHGGELKFNDNGKLFLNGDTGISAGVKDELASIKGQPRIIPIFEKVSGPGNNASYTIIKFVGVTILDEKLTGSMNSKAVTIQPAFVVTGGGIPGNETQSSQYVFSKPFLVH
jgi:Flp pilus assembly protein TadG